MLLLVVLWTLSLIWYGRHTNCTETYARVYRRGLQSDCPSIRWLHPFPLSTVTRVSTISTYHSLLPVLFFRLSWQAAFLQGRTPYDMRSTKCRSDIVCGLTNVSSPYSVGVLSFETFTSIVCFLVFPSSWQKTITCFYSAKDSLCPPSVSKLSNQVMYKTNASATLTSNNKIIFMKLYFLFIGVRCQTLHRCLCCMSFVSGKRS